MGGDVRRIPRVSSGTSANWVGEGDTISAGDPVFDRVNLTAKKLATLTRITTEMAEDSAINLAEWLAEDFSRAFAEAEDDAAINGDGTSTYGGVYGVVGQMNANEGWASVQTAASGNDQFGEYVPTDLTNVMGKLEEYAYGRDPAWYCSRVCYGTLFQRLGMAGGGTTTMSLREDLRTLAGFEIRMSPKFNTSTGDQSEEVVLLFGDLRSVVTLGDRQETRVKVLSELYADSDEIGLRATERIGIAVHSLGDASTVGPIVGLMGE